MDYKKWDSIIDSESDEESDSLTVSEKWERVKSNTDRLMTEGNFEVALRGYEELLKNLLQENDVKTTDHRYKRLTISCRLGAACCHLKLQGWLEALNLCRITRKFNEKDLSPIENTRTFYFESFSLYNLANINPSDSQLLDQASVAC